MRNTLICTVGTSLLNNLKNQSNPEIQKNLEARNSLAISLKLLEFSPEDRICGAEINSNTSILKKRIIEDPAHLYLMVSDTAEGKFVGSVLRHYYKSSSNRFRFGNVECIVVSGLTDEDPDLFRREGLRNLVREIAKIARNRYYKNLIINATGGYKAQISFAGMIGQALEIPVCYLFERFSEVITLPPQPVSLDMKFWLNNADTFFKLDKEGLNHRPREERFEVLIEEIKDSRETLYILSDIGQLFHEAFRHVFSEKKEDFLPPPCGIPPDRKVVKYEDQNPGRHSGLREWIEKIRRLPYVTGISTFYYNPDLPLKNSFTVPTTRISEVNCVEGTYSDGKATTRFNIFTTATTPEQRGAAIADLNNLLE